MPTPTISPLERAFELAQSGRCKTVQEILQTLKKEGHDPGLVVGPYLMRQLRLKIHDATRLNPGS